VSVARAYLQVSQPAVDTVVTEHSELVRRIAYHLAARLPASVEVDDLIQAGMVGLLEAARHFDASQGASFSTFAGIRIRGAMLDELRRGDWTPRSVHRKSREAAKAVRAIEARTGRAASDAEVARELGIDAHELQQLNREAASAPLMSLDELPADVVDGIGALDTPEEDVENSEFRSDLVHAVANLPERERLVMSLYYEQELNLREIAAVIGVSESRVCQIHGQALVRLRARLGDWLH
tara:strand:+ start:9268 stop:9981 length:714 start_codon:yes stop_codon:yes gene_type:complete